MSKFKKFVKQNIRRLNNITFSSKKYWEKRYARGGNSGAGSYNQIAKFKNKVINEFIDYYNINKILDYGCGDGNQCKEINAQQYLGIDISETSINICKEKFINDSRKDFMIYNKETESFIKSYKPNLVLSLDVIYHLVEDKTFKQYINNLFLFSNRYVIIFSTNRNEKISIHHKNRKFTDYIEKHMSNWKLQKFVENPIKGTETQSDFYIYELKK